MLLTYLENGNDFTLEFGDIDERFYDSLCSVMDELASVLNTQGSAAYEKVADRLSQLSSDADGLGWGYGDHVTGVVASLDEELSSSSET